MNIFHYKLFLIKLETLKLHIILLIVTKISHNTIYVFIDFNKKHYTNIYLENKHLQTQIKLIVHFVTRTYSEGLWYEIVDKIFDTFSLLIFIEGHKPV